MDAHLPMIVSGLQREIDAIKREMDYRGTVITRGDTEIRQIKDRIRAMEVIIPMVLERIKAIETQSNLFKSAEVLIPLALVIVAIVLKVPLADIKAMLIK